MPCVLFGRTRHFNSFEQRVIVPATVRKGVVFGRPTVRMPENYEAVMEKVARGDMKAVEAMREMGIKKTTFYKLKKLYPMEVTAWLILFGCVKSRYFHICLRTASRLFFRLWKL